MESAIEVKSIFWIGTFVMLFLAFGLLFLVFFYQNHFAKTKQKEAELLLKTSLESEKRERQRIAKDLHDSVQGDLNAIRNYFLLLTRKLENSEHTYILDDIKQALEQTVENTRQISYKLMPPLLESGGFTIAISDYFENLSKASGKKFIIHADMIDLVIPLDKSYELFRIVQEFIQNMLKHGAIQECNLFVYELSGTISIELIDDGIPFNFKSSYILSKGSGLQNIQSRLTSIKANLVQRDVVIGNHFVIYLNLNYD
jgi:signal transduction histidine kinase